MLRFGRLGAAFLLLGFLFAAAPALAQIPGQISPCPVNTTPRIISAATVTLSSADKCQNLILTNSGAITVQLPAPGLIFSPGWSATLLPLNGGQITFTGLPDQAGAVHKINQQTSLALPAGIGGGLMVMQDMNWWASEGGGSSIGNLPHFSSNSALQAQITTSYTAVVRDGFASAGDSPPLNFQAQTGTCAANGMTNDRGSCVNTNVGGNSWKAVLPLANLDARWWGKTTNPVNMYTSPTGNDNGGSNFCFDSSAPCTLQGAVNQAVKFNVNGGWVQINLGANTYTSGITCNGAGGGVGPIYLVGAGSGSTTIADGTINPAAVIATEYCELGLQALKITSSNGSAVFPQHHARISFIGDLNIGATALGQLHAETGGIIEIPASYTISGGAPAHLQAVLDGQIIYDEAGGTVTLTGTPAFSIGFADIESGSVAYIPNGFVSFSGAATGPRALVKSNGKIETNSGTATFLPGNTSIQYNTGGKYLPMPSPSLAGTTGLGTGSGTMVANSTDYSWLVQLSPTGSPSGSGTVTVNNAGILANPICAPVLLLGSAAWDTGATVQLGGLTTGQVVINWKNGTGPTALTAGQTYFIGCNAQN